MGKPRQVPKDERAYADASGPLIDDDEEEEDEDEISIITTRAARDRHAKGDKVRRVRDRS